MQQVKRDYNSAVSTLSNMMDLIEDQDNEIKELKEANNDLEQKNEELESQIKTLELKLYANMEAI